MNGSAPNSSCTGSQIERVIKSKPNFSNDNCAFIAMLTMMMTTSPATTSANMSVVSLNNESAQRPDARARLTGRLASGPVSGGVCPVDTVSMRNQQVVIGHSSFVIGSRLLMTNDQ